MRTKVPPNHSQHPHWVNTVPLCGASKREERVRGQKKGPGAVCLPGACYTPLPRLKEGPTVDQVPTVRALSVLWHSDWDSYVRSQLFISVWGLYAKRKLNIVYICKCKLYHVIPTLQYTPHSFIKTPHYPLVTSGLKLGPSPGQRSPGAPVPPASCLATLPPRLLTSKVGSKPALVSHFTAFCSCFSYTHPHPTD